MRIGVDISDLATERADGTTRYTYELAKRLPVIGKEHQWVYFTPSLSHSLTKELGQRNVVIAISPWFKYWTQLRLPWELYRYNVDVLFMPIQQLPLLRPRKIKTVAVMHDLAFHEYGEQFTYKDWALLHIFSAQAAREADQIIAVSMSTGKDTTKYYGRKARMAVVHHSVDKEKFRPPADGEEKTKTRASLLNKFPSLEKPYLLYVGQIQPRKNLVRLVEAFEEMSKEDKELQLVLAGGHGWLREPIEKRVRDSKFKERIHMVGRVDDEILKALYWNAEVYTLISTYEGFGMPILEAMACGCAVVTSNASAMPEAAGGAAVLINPLSLESVVNGIKQGLREKLVLSERSIERVKDLSWDKTAKDTLDILVKQ